MPLQSDGRTDKGGSLRQFYSHDICLNEEISKITMNDINDLNELNERNNQMLVVSQLLSAQNIYSMAFEAALKLFELSRLVPHDGPGSLHNKIIQSSAAVCSHLTDAWQNRDKKELFLAKLDQATIDISETQIEIESAVNCGYLDAELGKQLCDKYNQLLYKIVEVIKEPNQWLVHSTTIKPKLADVHTGK